MFNTYLDVYSEKLCTLFASFIYFHEMLLTRVYKFMSAIPDMLFTSIYGVLGKFN